MAEFKTPAGVVIRTSAVAARAVGFTPVAPPAKAKPKRAVKADADDE